LGQPSFLVATAATTQLGLSAPRQLDFDNASGQLFVTDTTNNRVVVYGPATTQQVISGSGSSTPGNSFYFFGF
jgi:hypothetical protein